MTTEPSSSGSQNVITIVSSDGVEFEIDVALAQQSETLSDLMSNFDYSREDVKKEPIPLGNVSSVQMVKVLKWMRRHRNAQPWVPGGDGSVPNYKFDNWTTAYLDISNNQLFELVKAANYLNIPHLSDTVCRKVASKIAGKNTDEMRQALNLPPNGDKEEIAETMDDDEVYAEEPRRDVVMREASSSSDSEDEEQE